MNREEAIDIIRKNIPHLGIGAAEMTEALNELIPELRESEDEKIRKDIIGGLMWQRDNLKSVGPHDNNLILPGFCFTVGKHLTYLEKQKEQKPADNPKWAELTWKDINELERIINNVHYEFQNGIGEDSFGELVLERFREYKEDEDTDEKEQKPVEWSEGDTLMCNAALELLRSHPNLMASHGINKSSVIRWLQSFRPQKQGFIDDICSKAGIAIPYLDGNQWCILKGANIQAGVVGFGGTKEDALANFIKDVPIPQQWSKEDENMVNNILYVLGQYIDYKAVSGTDTGSGYATPRYAKEMDWLKSLRPQWKPTEEQMEALAYAIQILDDGLSPKAAKAGEELEGIREHFKKL